MSYTHNVDPEGRLRCYGLYSGVVTNINDPLKKNRIQVQIPSLMATESTNWAKACLPITANSYHPDHIAHTATQVAALLNAHADHTVSGSTGSAGSPSHTHTFSATVSHTNNHTGNSGTLTHPHTPNHSMLTLVQGSKNSYLADGIIQSAVEIDTSTYGTSGVLAPDFTANPEHTFHRSVPNVGQQVWVMFEGGDPDLPVWVGVQS